MGGRGAGGGDARDGGVRVGLVGGSTSATATPSGQMILATTTSTRDTGLLDTLVPAFEKASKCSVKTVAVGSGQAIDLGARGQADVLLVHSPDAEKKFMAEGHGVSRLAVMHNDFVLVGPPADPAKAAGAGGIESAMQAIAQHESSVRVPGRRLRHQREGAQALGAGRRHAVGVVVHQDRTGHGTDIDHRRQKRAYTLSDRGTFLATRT